MAKYVFEIMSFITIQADSEDEAIRKATIVKDNLCVPFMHLTDVLDDSGELLEEGIWRDV